MSRSCDVARRYSLDSSQKNRAPFDTRQKEKDQKFHKRLKKIKKVKERNKRKNTKEQAESELI